jgi:hypothetical protein
MNLFYKTEHAAYIGDLFMSLIRTCNLCKVNPFEHLKTLQQHSSKLFQNPNQWMPWNYEKATSPVYIEFFGLYPQTKIQNLITQRPGAAFFV